MAQATNTDIEYVYIEMVLNKEHKYEVVSGMLQGIKTRDGVTFILLHGKKEATNIISLRYYNVMTVEILHKDHKDMTYLTTKEDDQKAALTILNNVYKSLLEDNLGQNSDGDLINVSRYTNVPQEYGGTIVKQHSLPNKPSHMQYNGVGNFANRSGSASTYTPATEKKEIVPAVFNRSVGSKKPSKASLIIMAGKIDQINDGKFVCTLPETVNEEGEEDDGITNLYDNDYLHWA